MSGIEQASITRRIMLSYGFLMLTFFLFSAFILYDIQKVSNLSRTIYNHPLVVSNAALQANVSITKMHRNMKDVVLFHSLSRIHQSIEAVNEEKEEVYGYLNIVKKNILGEKGKTLELEARNLFDKWQLIRNEVIELVNHDQRDKAAIITIGKGAGHVALLEEKMLGLTNYARNKASEFTRETEKVHSTLNVTSIFFLIVGILISVLVAFFTIKWIALAEGALRESESRLREAQRLAHMGNWSWDVNSGKVEWSNEVFKIFRLDPKEFTPQIDSIQNLSPWPEDYQRDKELIQKAIENREVGFYEQRFLRPDGSTGYFFSSFQGIFDDNEKLTAINGMVQDITDRKESEASLKKAYEESKELATKLTLAIQIKSEFLANMSHELRTPLNSIIGFSEVLYDETFGPLNEKQKHYVSNVLTSGKYLLLLINQILDMAKVESGKMNMALSSLSVQSLLNEILLLVEDMVGKKKIKMLLEIADDLPNIEADDLKVKEILYNLLSNAVKFTPEGRKIGMRVKKTDSEIEIVVWDTGVGIASENMEKIFEGFFRVDSPYSRLTEGTGLGLPLSKKLVELHGGKLSVESEGIGKGTSVRFTLPITSRREA